jgi:thioredoxin reductase
MIHDVIVIGGSYAGMAASLQLLRARRSVLVIDGGQRRNRFPAELGCEIAENPMDRIIAVNASKQTTVPGVFACGDVAFIPGAVSFAVGDGALAGIQLHRSQVWPETVS